MDGLTDVQTDRRTVEKTFTSYLNLELVTKYRAIFFCNLMKCFKQEASVTYPFWIVIDILPLMSLF